MDEHDETQTMMPDLTEPAPPSDEFDTVLHAKDRAAVAIFTSIEALANDADVSPSKLDSLTHAFARMNDTLKAEPDMILSETGVFGTRILPDPATYPEAMEAFFREVRRICGLSPTTTELLFGTPLGIQETLAAVGQLWQRATNAEESLGGAGASVRDLTEQLNATRRERDAWRYMHEQMSFVVREEIAKLGIAPRFWLPPEEAAKVAERFADLNDADRARYAGNATMVRQIVEHYKKTMDEFDALSRGDVRPRQGCEIAERFRRLFDELKESSALVSQKQEALKLIRKELALRGFSDFILTVDGVRALFASIDKSRVDVGSALDRLSSTEADLAATRATTAECRNECEKLRRELGHVDESLAGLQPSHDILPRFEHGHRMDVLQMKLREADQRDKALKLLATIEDLMDGTIGPVETEDRLLAKLQEKLNEANGIHNVHGALLQKLYALYYRWKGSNGTAPAFAILLKEAINSALGEDATGTAPPGTNEIGSIIGVAMHSAAKDQPVQIAVGQAVFAKP